ncbi:CoA transferase subunit A [Thermoanaerobacterium sp. DL9XJH110]|uniref:CoA transferase subunit A n=1 Tax=Thermoanaerobacterium sp. DL9XJH110 TaxID=3386643 RepID=UPI003BB72296
MKSKVMGLGEAVREIPDEGAHIAVGGFAITRNPIAFVNEIIRQKKKELNVYQTIAGMDTDLLVGAGAVRKLTYSGGSLDRFGRLERINEAIDRGRLDIREYSGLSLTLRFLAGSMGIPFIPTKSLLGTDMLRDLIAKKDDSVKIETSPFDGEKYVFLKSLQPDIVVIHAQYADENGNVVIEGPVWDVEMAKAAKKLYVTVEKIVSTEYIKQHPEKVAIPSVYTHAVIEVPFGAFPTAVYKVYDYDKDFLTRYAKINKNEEDFNNYLAEYVFGTKDHNEFLEKIGGLARLNGIKADPVFGYRV